jgi:hypothetical protein
MKRNVYGPSSFTFPLAPIGSLRDPIPAYIRTTFTTLGLLFDPEDGGNMFLQTISKLLPDDRPSQPRKYILQK